MGSQIYDIASMKREPASGISMLIVGGGIAGFTMAIEGYRKGHDVRIIERRPDIKDYGDIIAIQDSAVHSPKNWPGFMERCNATPIPRKGYMFKYDGTHLGFVNFPISISRAVFHDLLYEYVEKLGIDIQFSTHAVDYFETDDQGGVILEDGSKLTADLVVAADGVGTKSWRIVTGHKEAPVSSTFAMFRSTYPLELAMKSPLVAKRFESHPDGFAGIWIGPRAHIIVGKTDKDIIFMLTHKDTANAEEEWTKLVSVEHAVPFVKDWEPFLADVVKNAPDGKAVDFKLMWRNPRHKWTSPKARIIQIGDAAHTFLPTSASGSTMAMEDAFSLAACLHKSGKENIQTAVRAHNHFRAERVACAQKMGFKTRELYHNTDWEVMDKDPTRMTKMVGQWVKNHDPEQYAYDNYDKCVSHLLHGTPFKNTNGVPGYTYKPWTIQELLAASERGGLEQDEGDWE